AAGGAAAAARAPAGRGPRLAMRGGEYRTTSRHSPVAVPSGRPVAARLRALAGPPGASRRGGRLAARPGVALRWPGRLAVPPVAVPLRPGPLALRPAAALRWPAARFRPAWADTPASADSRTGGRARHLRGAVSAPGWAAGRCVAGWGDRRRRA